MKNILLVILLSLTSLVVFGQTKKENSFFTWENFVDGFGKEIVLAEDVYDRMAKDGLKENSLTKMDFTFVSDKEENLIELGKFIKTHYPYSVQEIKQNDKHWEINGETNLFPMTADNLMYWVLDMYKRGFDFDAVFDAYGGEVDSKTTTFPIMDSAKGDYYFEKGVDCYYHGDLSGSIFNWSLAIENNFIDPNVYYFRAIVKNELYAWKFALIDYDKAIELDPKFVEALIYRGVLKDENEDYKGAIADYEIVLKLEELKDKEKQQAYFSLGNTYLNMKDEDKACENWYKALSNGAEYANERINEYCNKTRK
jgi:tetratricopeptide (TPR) repeat protein